MMDAHPEWHHLMDRSWKATPTVEEVIALLCEILPWVEVQDRALYLEWICYCSRYKESFQEFPYTVGYITEVTDTWEDEWITVIQAGNYSYIGDNPLLLSIEQLIA